MGTDIVPLDTVRLPITIDEAIRQWEEYQDLTRRLLDESDYQGKGKDRFKKKSAWRKYAKAFNLADRVSAEEIQRAEDGWPIWARIRVIVTAPNGREAEADHEAHLGERCCPGKRSQPCRKATWEKHECCLPTCDPRSHWAHPGDIPATALTRAKNRAIADLIGAGEVSAEEMDGARPEPVHTPAPPRGGQALRFEYEPTLCPICGTAWKLVPAGVSQAGKRYDAFHTCSTRGCKGRPTAIVPVREEPPIEAEVVDRPAPGELPITSFIDMVNRAMREKGYRTMGDVLTALGYTRQSECKDPQADWERLPVKGAPATAAEFGAQATAMADEAGVKGE